MKDKPPPKPPPEPVRKGEATPPTEEEFKRFLGKILNVPKRVIDKPETTRKKAE